MKVLADRSLCQKDCSCSSAVCVRSQRISNFECVDANHFGQLHCIGNPGDRSGRSLSTNHTLAEALEDWGLSDPSLCRAAFRDCVSKVREHANGPLQLRCPAVAVGGDGVGTLWAGDVRIWAASGQ